MSNNGGEKKPEWIKLWAGKYADILDIDNIEDYYADRDEWNSFVIDMGFAFLNLLYAYNNYGDFDTVGKFEIEDRMALAVYKSMIRDLKQSYEGYKKRCEVNQINGEKGGRPPGKATAKPQTIPSQGKPYQIQPKPQQTEWDLIEQAKINPNKPK
jgi:hypothetical protein